MNSQTYNSEAICSVSSNGDCVALCTPDGVIKFYDTLTSTLKQEYSSSTHLQAGCTCISWPKVKRDSLQAQTSSGDSKPKKVKTNSNNTKASNIENQLNDLDLLAIGTAQGSILLYSLTKGSLHTQLDEGHSDKVNDICWCPLMSDSLYSCSDDGYIIEWSLIESKVKSKWKASKTAITAISIDPSAKYLVCSSKTITVWDLKTKTKVKSFTGHSNDIFKIEFLKTDLVENQELMHLISAALNDRIINGWSINSSRPSESSNMAFQSYTINDGPIFIETLTVRKNDQNLTAVVLALTQKGQLFIFNHELESQTEKNIKKPLKSQNSLKIETKEGSSLKIFATFVTDSKNKRLNFVDLKNTTQSNSLSELLSESYLYLVYGSHLNPKIEKLPFSELNEAKLTLKRDDPYKTNVTLQTQSTKIETPIISKELKVLIPGYDAPQTNNHISINPSNTKRKSVEPSQMTLEDRLNVMGLSSKTSETEVNGKGDLFFKNGQVPKTDNLLVLLVQGLQSNDAKMLNHVLQHKNDKVIAKTVRILPTNYIIQLIKELNKRLQGHAQSGLGLIKWLKSVLIIHTSYLVSYPDLIESLGSVYEMMNARTKLFPQLSKLQGKLQLVMSQVTSQAEGLPVGNEKEALLYYQDSTSEDEQIEDELIPSHSEFDDYVFSDEEEEEESNHEDEQDNMDENNPDSKKIKKDSISFKKIKNLSKNSLLKKNKKESDDEDSDNEDEDIDENDETKESNEEIDDEDDYNESDLENN